MAHNQNFHEQKPLRGLDVSSYQGKIDWHLVADNGINFVFIKATDGDSFVDPEFSTNMSGARAAKIPCGAYHYFRPNTSARKQAQIFLRTVGSLQPGDLIPVLDLEVTSNWRLITPKKRIRLIEKWIVSVTEALQCDVILCIAAPLAADISLTLKDLKYRLWVTDHSDCSNPFVPKTWATWTFWQYTNRGRIEGIDGRVDLDLFNGTEEELSKFRKH